MKHLDKMDMDALDALARTAPTRKVLKWVCHECAKDLEVSLNVGQPERRVCDKCHGNHKCYQIV